MQNTMVFVFFVALVVVGVVAVTINMWFAAKWNFLEKIEGGLNESAQTKRI